MPCEGLTAGREFGKIGMLVGMLAGVKNRVEKAAKLPLPMHSLSHPFTYFPTTF
jgi:hypothetical protein